MSTTPELVEHYKLHPLDPTAESNLLQPLVFKSWKTSPGDTSAPPRGDLSKPVAVESKRFPNNYLAILWSRGASAAQNDPDEKNVADFVVLLSADRTVKASNVNRVHRIAWGMHSETGAGINTILGTGRRVDGEHATWNDGANTGRISYHGYVIYPKGVPLGSSPEARRARWTNKHLTSADAALTKLFPDQAGTEVDPNVSEALGYEIFTWFRTEFSKPEHAGEQIRRVLIYDPVTRIVQVFKEDSEGESAPEHTFSSRCRLPAEKLGLATQH